MVIFVLTAHAEGLEPLRDKPFVDFNAEHALDLGLAQGDRFDLRQAGLMGRLHERPGLAPGKRQDQRRRALDSGGLPARVHPPLKTMRGVGLHPVAPRLPHHLLGRKKRAFQKNMPGGWADGAGLAAHESSQGQWPRVIGDQQGGRADLVLGVIQQGDPLARFGIAHADNAAQAIIIKGVQRLAGFEHDIVRDIDHQIDAAQTRTAQFFPQPKRRRRRHIDIFNDPAHIMRARLFSG